MSKFFNKIINGDSLKELKKIPDKIFDLVFADPPYNLGKNFDGLLDKYDQNNYKSWVKNWLKEIKRVTKPDASIYIMNSTQNMPWVDLYARDHFEILCRIVWAYDSSSLQAKKFFGSAWEPILFMVRDKKNYTFNADSIAVPTKTGAERKLVDYRKSPPKPYKKTKVPNNLWYIPRVRYKMKEYEVHPTQKPIALLERIIKASSKDGDVVLDVFSGTFTTGSVAKGLNRRTVSIEINTNYVDVGKRRLNFPSDLSPQIL